MSLRWSARHAAWASVALLATLAGCGGGGGGSVGGGASNGSASTSNSSSTGSGTSNTQTRPTPSSPAEIVDSRTVAAMCAAPRAASRDRPGSLSDEKRWVRSWIDETYLWYDEVPALKQADYATPVDYFNVLKTSATTSSGKPKDRFHFSIDTATWEGQSERNQNLGYGIEFTFLASAPPRDVRVAYVQPGSPAQAAGIERGMRLFNVDGIDVISGGDVDALNAGLAPAKAGESHRLGFRRVDGSSVDMALVSAEVIDSPVMNVKVLDTPDGKVGYLQFNTHTQAAEAPLMDAIAYLRDAAVTDLVLDMRYNGGGLLGIAAELASMIAPSGSTVGQTFERMIFNRKLNAAISAASTRMPFYATAQYDPAVRGRALPRLNLSRVMVLAGGATCSASESVVNGLRGIGVKVDLVGGTTCGKPYGFLPQDNCGTTYFAVQFQGVNAREQGNYADGMAPTCTVADDLSHQLGDPAEARLATALELRRTGRCPAPVTAMASGSLKGSLGSLTGESRPDGQLRPKLTDNRILLPQDLMRE
ncbi:S41 family peptidase [Variovorax dokdonensis]|uniref:S41 family peptidase n=1 Tax=Variovorax dokdonensis TaxID=344883 RepID=A0ABT7NFH2_9BURK|nr:S41 family peptidase [Variovorax dokdonensis]MDM0046691.1 S41 family peptidase [Variovorax dokdonensis]